MTIDLSNKFDATSIYTEYENVNDRYPNVIFRIDFSSRDVIVSYYVTWHFMCQTRTYVNGVERADMCEISLIFELGWQWWYKRGTCTTRIVPCTGWQISPSRHPCPSPYKYIRGWSSHWRKYFRARTRARRFNTKLLFIDNW